jgi:hypothetical protein
MSIDARVQTVHFNEDGSGWLDLIDRPASPGGVPGIAGQTRLRFDASPHDVTALNGRDIWGGSSEIMLGDVKIAERIGYTRIRFIGSARDWFRKPVASHLEPAGADVKGPAYHGHGG